MKKVVSKARRQIDQKVRAMDRDAHEALIASPHSGTTQFSRSNCELRAGVLVQGGVLKSVHLKPSGPQTSVPSAWRGVGL